MAEIIGRVGWRNYLAPSTSTNPLWNSLVAYYSGDNTANDSKGTANGTLVNGATYSTGKINNGFSLDGINDYVSIPNGTFNPTSGSYAISAWISSTPVAAMRVKTIFGLGGFTTNSIVVYLYNDESSTKIRFLNSNSGAYQLIESPIPSFGSFHHILCVKDTASNKYYLYVNGSLVAQANISINYVANNLGTNIGSFGNGFNGYNPFGGIIDEVGLWNRALTAAEVTELYNAGAGKQYVAPYPTSLKLFIDAGNPLSYPGSGTAVTDLTGNNNNGTLTNGASWSSSNNGVFTFDGVNDYIDVASLLPETTLTANDSFSVSVWFNPSTLPGGGANLFGRNNNNDGNHLLRTEGNVIRGGVRDVNGNGNILTGVSPLSTNNWYMASYTYNGNTKTVNLYLNSSLETTGTNNSLTGNLYNANHVYIAQRVNDLFFQGKIGVVKFYLETRTASNILADFNEFKSRYGY